MWVSIVIKAFLHQPRPWSYKNYNIPGTNGAEDDKLMAVDEVQSMPSEWLSADNYQGTTWSQFSTTPLHPPTGG